MIFNVYDYIYLISFYAGAPPELENSAAPLMLTGIPSADFALARDFLVTHEEQLNVMTGYKNQTLEIEDAKVSRIDVKDRDDPQLAMHLREDSMVEILPDGTKDEALKESGDKKGVRRSKRQINDKKTICEW